MECQYFYDLLVYQGSINISSKHFYERHTFYNQTHASIDGTRSTQQWPTERNTKLIVKLMSKLLFFFTSWTFIFVDVYNFNLIPARAFGETTKKVISLLTSMAHKLNFWKHEQNHCYLLQKYRYIFYTKRSNMWL